MTRITLDLLDNNTHGRWRAQMGNLVAFKVPKDLLRSDIPGAHGLGLYFLFSDSAMYVGSDADVLKKIQTGHSYADWKDSILILSTNSSLTEKNTNYLWAELCKSALEGKYKVINDYIPAQPILSGSERDNLDVVLQMIGTLLYTLGRDLFDAKVAVAPPPPPPSRGLFYIKKKGGADAKGCWEDGSITVLAGSGIRPIETDDCSESIRGWRQDLMSAGIIRDFKFTQDHRFNTPSRAAVVILGCSSNGWDEWKNKDGKSLKSVIGK